MTSFNWRLLREKMGYWSSLFSQDGWILAKFIFFACSVSVHELAKKRTRSKSSHLNRTSLVSKVFIVWLAEKFSWGTWQVVPSEGVTKTQTPKTNLNNIIIVSLSFYFRQQMSSKCWLLLNLFGFSLFDWCNNDKLEKVNISLLSGCCLWTLRDHKTLGDKNWDELSLQIFFKKKFEGSEVSGSEFLGSEVWGLRSEFWALSFCDTPQAGKIAPSYLLG